MLRIQIINHIVNYKYIKVRAHLTVNFVDNEEVQVNLAEEGPDTTQLFNLVQIVKEDMSLTEVVTG